MKESNKAQEAQKIKNTIIAMANGDPVREAWIQLGRDLRREQYVPLDSVNNPSIKMLDIFKASLRNEIEERIEELENDESEFSDEEVFFALRENRAFLTLLDTCIPTVKEE